ncbi:hypothetical protein GCM10029963_58810 [Micromonospora andamanensis]
MLAGTGARPEHARALLDALRTAGLVVPAHTLVPRDLTGPRRARLAAEAGALALATAQLPGTPAQVLRRRLAARVTITGSGPLGPAIAVALAQAGVGHVHPDLPGPVRPVDLVGTGIAATEIGHPLDAAVRAAVQRAAPGTGTGPLRRPRPDLVVQLGSDRPAALLAAGHAQRRQPHLFVDIREGFRRSGHLSARRSDPACAVWTCTGPTGTLAGRRSPPNSPAPRPSRPAPRVCCWPRPGTPSARR